jgi:hypothetical protein
MGRIGLEKIYKLEEGVDEKGKFTKYRMVEEVPCGCHPETCSHFSGKVDSTRDYKKYEDGSVTWLTR